MRFWDSSAVVPLLVQEPSSSPLLDLLEADARMLVWWGTPVECTSALAREERAGNLGAQDVLAALDRLAILADGWNEVLPSEPVRSGARRALRLHPLRAADALQLAAALVVAGGDPASIELVCQDARLADAASREGLRVVSFP